MIDELEVTGNVLEDRVQAIHNGDVYYEMFSHYPDMGLLLNQTSRIMAYHPLRDTNKKCIYYIWKDGDKITIRNCRSENDVPSNCNMAHNWLLNEHIKEDKKRKIKPLLNNA